MLRPSPGQNIGVGLALKPKLAKSAQINSPEKRTSIMDKKMVSKQSSMKGAKLVQLLEGMKSSSLMFDMELESGGGGGGGTRAKSFDMREQINKQKDEKSFTYGALNCSIEEEEAELKRIGGSTRNNQSQAIGGYFEILGKPQTELEILLYQQVKVLSPACKNGNGSGSGGGLFDLRKLADLLNKIGYQVFVEETSVGGKGAKSDATSVPHMFLICCGHAQRPESPKAEIVLDPCFRQQFNIANSTNSYQDLLKGVPEIFVGSKERLAKVVRKLSDEMKESFRDKGLPLPPWRSPRAMLAKWFSHEEIQDLVKKLEAKKQEQRQKPTQIQNTTTNFNVFQTQGVKKAVKFQPIEGINNLVTKITLGTNNNNNNNNNNGTFNTIIGTKEGTMHGNNNYKRFVQNESIFKQVINKQQLEVKNNNNQVGGVNSATCLENFIPRDASLLSQAVKMQRKEVKM